MQCPVSGSAEQKVQWLLSRMRAAGGLAPVDLKRFWADQEAAMKDPFGPDIPQVPLGAICNWECVFAEMGVEQDWKRYQQDHQWRLALNKAYNDKAEKIVGRRLLSEQPAKPRGPAYPPTKALHDVFEMPQRWDDTAQTWYLLKGAENEDGLKALLDRVEKRLEDLRAFILPDGWDAARRKLTARGIKPHLYRGQRGPVTFASSLYGVEGLVFLILDNPPLAGRLRDAILKAMLGIARILDEEAGYTPQTAPRGFSFCDDNCCMLTSEMYEFFGYPILKAVFERYSPAPHDRRFQHSDSDMGHLLPILGRLNLTGTNFGPRVMVDEIRRHMPTAVIHGQLAPFTFSRNEEENIVREFLRDFEMAREKRGLVFATAGSINNGSRLTGMRLIMSAIQHFGRYDR